MKSVLKSCRPGLPVTIAFFVVALILTAHVCMTIVQAAGPLLEENFEYGGTAGDLTAVSGGNWAVHSGAFVSPVMYVPSSLSLPDYSLSGFGGSATFAGGSGSRDDVNRPFAAQSSGTVYYAALVNLSSATTGDYFLHFKDAGTNFRGRLFAQDSGGNLLFGLSSSGSSGTYGATNFSYNTTYLAVVKYEIGTGNSALYVLDSCSGTEPATPLVVSTGTANPMSAIAIRQGGISTAGAIDGIRVGTTWAEAVRCGPFVSITKSVSPSVDVGFHSPVTYTVVLENRNETDDPNAMLTDTLPAEVDFARWVEEPEGAAVSADEITWSGTVTASEAITFTFVVTHVGDPGDVVTNTAVFSGASGIREAEATFSVEKLFDVGVLKTADPAQVLVVDEAGALVTYTLTISNLSTVTDTTRVTVTDVLPPGFVYVSDTSPVPPTSTDPLVWNLTNPITAGEGLTFQVVVSATGAITRSGSYNNEVTVDTEPPDSLVGNNTADAAVTVYRLIPIAEARLRPMGEPVMIEGTVTVEPGIFKESTLPNRKLYVQDDTGGVQVYRASELDPVDRHHRVWVLGTLGEYRTETEVMPVLKADVIDLGLATPIVPLAINTGAVDESVEGQLVHIAGYITGKPAAYRLQVNDGSGMVEVYRYYNLGQAADPNYIDFTPLVVGDYVSVTGVTRGYDYSGTVRREVLPRGPADVEELYLIYLPLVAKNYP